MKYCTAYINFFDNELKQEIVEASSELEALQKSSITKDLMSTIEPDNHDLEFIKEEAFNQDSMLSVIEVK